MISVMTVCYNRPTMLARLLDSLEEQEGFEWLLFDDNSKPEIELLARKFLETHPGQYVKSDIQDSERPKSVRYGVGINTLCTLAKGDIFTHFGSDSEATPGLFRQVLGGFQGNAVYTGIQYRWADVETGQILRKMACRYPKWLNYGKQIDGGSRSLDASQLYYKRECAVRWQEHHYFWFTADVMAISAIIDKAGRAYPLGDPLKNLLVYNNINRLSLTRLGSPEAVVEALR